MSTGQWVKETFSWGWALRSRPRYPLYGRPRTISRTSSNFGWNGDLPPLVDVRELQGRLEEKPGHLRRVLRRHPSPLERRVEPTGDRLDILPPANVDVHVVGVHPLHRRVREAHVREDTRLREDSLGHSHESHRGEVQERLVDHAERPIVATVADDTPREDE
jgi:hypothetical protein